MSTLHTIFDWLIAASLRASVLTLLVFAFQWLLQRHLSPRWRYALWLPVLVVLIAPVLPESRWSIERVFQTKPQPVEMHSAPLIADSVPVSMPSTAPPVVSVPAPVDWNQVQLLTWALGASLLLLTGGVSFLRTLLRFRQSRESVSVDLLSQLEAISREVGLRHSPQVLVAPAIQSPAVTGLLRPTLLLPAGFERDFTAEEARLILQHELTHLKRHDLPLNTLLCVLMALHWFNPLLWLAFFMARADRETACDAQVLENATPQRRSEYGHALLKIEAAFAPLRLSLGFVGMLQRGATLRARIRSIARPSRTRPLAGLLATLCITGMTFLGVTRAEKPASGTSDDTKLIAIEVTTVHFKQDTSWDFDGRFKQLDPEDQGGSSGGQIALLSQEDVRVLKEKLQKEAGADVAAYPRMVTQDGKEVMIRSVVNQPVLGGKDTNGKSLIAYVPIGFVAKFIPRTLADGRVAVDMDLSDSRIVARETVQGSDYPVASSRVFRGPVELNPGITATHYAWQGHGWKGNKPVSYRPSITFVTTHVLDPKAGGLPADASGFTTGKSSFLPGDSIRIMQVQRSGGFMTVTADYELASADAANISLHITSTKDNGRTKTDPNQRKAITKGKGRVVLHHPDVREGMPHVSFYPNDGGSSFGDIYFGTQAEADASMKLDLSHISANKPFDDPASALNAKLNRIILPRVQFSGASIEEAMEYLQTKSREFDSLDKKGVQFLLRPGGAKPGLISLDLKEVPLIEALRYCTELAGLTYKVEPYAVIIAATTTDAPAKLELTAKSNAKTTVTTQASKIILPSVEFRDATLVEAIEFIRAKSREHDPDKKGVNILLKGDGGTVKITLSLKDVPVSEALHYCAELSNHKLSADENSFVLTPVLPKAGATTSQFKPAHDGALGANAQAQAQAAELRRAKPQMYDFAKANLGDVIRYLASDAGIRFFSLPEDHPTSQRLITFSIRSSPFEALETICRANGLVLMLSQDVWHAQASNDSALVEKNYALPKTSARTESILTDIRFLLKTPNSKSEEPGHETKSDVKFIPAQNSVHVTATRLQHMWVEGYFKGLGGNR
jgi:beta-lactamase regulating signal transducer with metallopeptidase domain